MDPRIFLISVAVIAVTGVPVPEPEINFGQTTTTTTTTPDPLVTIHQNVSGGVCKTMLPVHGNNRPQISEAPFTVLVSPLEVAPQGIVEVEVKSAQGDNTIRGVYMQARDSNQNPVGEFQPTTDSHVIISNCGNGNNNALMYVSHEPLSQLKFEWKAPEVDRTTPVKFYVTFVESFSVFWKPITSEKVFIKNKE